MVYIHNILPSPLCIRTYELARSYIDSQFWEKTKLFTPLCFLLMYMPGQYMVYLLYSVNMFNEAIILILGVILMLF